MHTEATTTQTSSTENSASLSTPLDPVPPPETQPDAPTVQAKPPEPPEPANESFSWQEGLMLFAYTTHVSGLGDALAEKHFLYLSSLPHLKGLEGVLYMSRHTHLSRSYIESIRGAALILLDRVDDPHSAWVYDLAWVQKQNLLWPVLCLLVDPRDPRLVEMQIQRLLRSKSKRNFNQLALHAIGASLHRRLRFCTTLANDLPQELSSGNSNA